MGKETLVFSVENFATSETYCQIKIDHLEIFSGKIYLLLGENGAGKSVMLKSLVGLTQAKWRSMLCLNQNILPPISPHFANSFFGFMHQNITPVHSMRVAEYVDLFSENYSKDILSMFEIKALLNKSIVNLSGGEWNRVRLAKVLATKKSLYLLDEPDCFLDLRFIGVLAEVLQTKKKEHSAFIVNSHSLALLIALKPTIMFLSNKKLSRAFDFNSLILNPVTEAESGTSEFTRLFKKSFGVGVSFFTDVDSGVYYTLKYLNL